MKFIFKTSGYPGACGNYYCDKGKLVLSNMRVVYISNDMIHFKSLEIPLDNLKEVKEKKSFLGYNMVEGVIIPIPNMGLTDISFMTLTFYKGGHFQFYSLYQHNQHSNNSRPIPSESLPLYEENTDHPVLIPRNDDNRE
jgi:hypothetical protein